MLKQSNCRSLFTCSTDSSIAPTATVRNNPKCRSCGLEATCRCRVRRLITWHVTYILIMRTVQATAHVAGTVYNLLYPGACVCVKKFPGAPNYYATERFVRNVWLVRGPCPYIQIPYRNFVNTCSSLASIYCNQSRPGATIASARRIYFHLPMFTESCWPAPLDAHAESEALSWSFRGGLVLFILKSHIPPA